MFVVAVIIVLVLLLVVFGGKESFEAWPIPLPSDLGLPSMPSIFMRAQSDDVSKTEFADTNMDGSANESINDSSNMNQYSMNSYIPPYMDPYMLASSGSMYGGMNPYMPPYMLAQYNRYMNPYGINPYNNMGRVGNISPGSVTSSSSISTQGAQVQSQSQSQQSLQSQPQSQQSLHPLSADTPAQPDNAKPETITPRSVAPRVNMASKHEEADISGFDWSTAKAQQNSAFIDNGSSSTTSIESEPEPGKFNTLSVQPLLLSKPVLPTINLPTIQTNSTDNAPVSAIPTNTITTDALQQQKMMQAMFGSVGSAPLNSNSVSNVPGVVSDVRPRGSNSATGAILADSKSNKTVIEGPPTMSQPVHTPKPIGA